MEKFVQMTTPNYKMSATRVLLKCVNKNITAEQLRTFVYSQFEGTINSKKLRTLKLLKDVKVVEDNGNARGFAFIDFAQEERALQFIRKAVERKDDTMAELGNNKGETPIIEFAFDDVKKMRKIEDIKTRQKAEVQAEQGEKEEEQTGVKDTKNEKKAFQKALQNNRKLMAKKLVGDAL